MTAVFEIMRVCDMMTIYETSRIGIVVRIREILAVGAGRCEIVKVVVESRVGYLWWLLMISPEQFVLWSSVSLPMLVAVSDGHKAACTQVPVAHGVFVCRNDVGENCIKVGKLMKQLKRRKDEDITGVA
ncbi:hypothetical protein E2P81_ATG03271 [Venturia nashicola]|uniref:Uncharacterized protein n=1 Tax=Venturia nashicola TaxID=86259 RepID=A0A4Z1PEV0_9PEZI|nr:hypothetical protein E6O75_ATG03337 [Venturia nashicola]TLD36382.1 hypothetical protein E2P81_ATG03271 [Venturia nashicola]